MAVAFLAQVFMSVAGLGQVIVLDFLDHRDTLAATIVSKVLWLHRLQWVLETRQRTPLVSRQRYSRDGGPSPSIADIVVLLLIL